MLAGLGVVALVRGRRAAGLGLAAALGAATLAFTAGDLSDQFDELGARADRREQLDVLLDRAGGAGGSSAAGPPTRTSR